MSRGVCACLVGLALAGVLATHAARAGAPELLAELRCARAAGPGRILCELTCRAPRGKLVWGDALVVRAPRFARPLRSRVLAQLGSAAPASASAKLALVASAAGEGQLEVQARAVVCHDAPSGEWCAPEAVTVSAPVLVAPLGP